MAYSFYRTITIDHTKCGASDSSNFPVLVSGTYSYLATVGNSGSVQNASGYDVVFASDSAGVSLLSWEVESYNAATGAVVYWVKVPTVSHTADTVIYLLYGNAAISTDQSNKTGAWDANYKAVYHLPDGTTFSANDSTSNANNAVTSNAITASAGQIGGAGTFASASNSYVDCGTSSSLDRSGANTLTVEAWVKRSASTSTGAIIARLVGGVGGWTVGIGVAPSTVNQIKLTKGGVADIFIGSFPADTAWHHLVGVCHSAGQIAYVDGVSNGTASDTANFLTCSTHAVIGAQDIVPSFGFTGSIDEVRVSFAARSADWVLTSYNSQKTPSTFYTVGTQQSGGGAAIMQRMLLLGCGS